jgi:hypothetical protein
MTDAIDINEDRRRRDDRRAMIGQIADLATTLPWSMDIREHSEFGARFPSACFADMEAAETEMARRLVTMEIGAAPHLLPHRRDRCVAAADWLKARPHISAPLVEPGFREAFGDLTRAELVVTTAMLRGSL